MEYGLGTGKILQTRAQVGDVHWCAERYVRYYVHNLRDLGMARVLVVGWDGATFDLIHPLVAAGKLPNLSRMMQQGAWGTLRSTVPPVTPAAWTSFFTGKNPGKHGIFDFQRLDPQSYTFQTVRTDQHREKTLWQLLDQAGKRSIVVDVPFTYPPQPLNGLMITGYGTPRTPGAVFTYPADLVSQIPAALQSEIRVALPRHRFERSRQFIEEWEQVMSGRRRLLAHLISQQDWDLFMVVFSITDNMAHVFWTYLDPAHPNFHKAEGETYRQAFLDAYAQCDLLLGELRQQAGPDTTTMVLSDHGFGSVRPRQYIFQRLLAGGFLHPSRDTRLGPGLLRLATDTYMRFPRLREWIKGLRSRNLRRVKRTMQRARLMPNSGVDFARSRVIASNFGLRLWINDWDRFAQGCVDPADRDRLVAELVTYLQADRDPVNGRPVIARVHDGSRLYHGPHAGLGPDLVIEYANHYRPDSEQPGQNPYLEGGHTLEGIFLAAGPRIRAARLDSQHPVPATLMDLAPTILYLFDQPIPPDLDGRLLSEIFEPGELTARPVRQASEPAQHAESPAGPGYSPAEQAEVEEQLRRLGYI